MRICRLFQIINFILLHEILKHTRSIRNKFNLHRRYLIYKKLPIFQNNLSINLQLIPIKIVPTINMLILTWTHSTSIFKLGIMGSLVRIERYAAEDCREERYTVWLFYIWEISFCVLTEIGHLYHKRLSWIFVIFLFYFLDQGGYYLLAEFRMESDYYCCSNRSE
jgi:hypothetical protein